MSDYLPNHKLVSAREMHDVIKRIIANRAAKAGQSEYDVMVCIRSVAAANEVFEGVPVEGDVASYGEAVCDALDRFGDDYYDTDGEYTSKGMVGDVYFDIYHFIESQASPDIFEIDRIEALAILNSEIRTLAQLTPRPPSGLGSANIKAKVSGASETQYFVAMKIRELSDASFAILGKIYSSESCQFPLIETSIEFDM